ncbi:hypothetical protein NC653_001122 [Populus alba x Populus x berolinensis]|uniref:Uncharacterized protein n=1 Tax=Populus alba x Populus x berolinensis TaxID=444605 RepID=A0AAD6WF45_9ROSI|nr:hypothetical protein NC653_001122 [Populus alba x Populus x berolinensis]
MTDVHGEAGSFKGSASCGIYAMHVTSNTLKMSLAEANTFASSLGHVCYRCENGRRKWWFLPQSCGLWACTNSIY